MTMFRVFDNDPFFAGHRDRMGQMFHGFNAVVDGTGFPMIADRPTRRRDQRNITRRDEVMPFGRDGDVFSDMMAHMGGMMSTFNDLSQRMQSQMSAVSSGEGMDGHSYVQSSVYSYRSTGEGKPQIYEAHHSRRTAPGGIKEEKKALRDSEREIEKMAVGRHIGNRGQVVQKTRNTRNNEMEEHQDLIGLAEDELGTFQQDWQTQTQPYNTAYQHSLDERHRGLSDYNRSMSDNRGRERLAIESPQPRRERKDRKERKERKEEARSKY